MLNPVDSHAQKQAGEPILDRAWISAHIPHQGDMCLLERVSRWDQQSIVCIATSHHAANNPLRAHGRLGISCGIEYAAQAMAVHGALLAPADSSRPRAGYLVSARGVTLHASRLDYLSVDKLDANAEPDNSLDRHDYELTIAAECIMRSDSNILYQFRVSTGSKLLLEGRAAIVINADALALPSAQASPADKLSPNT